MRLKNLLLRLFYFWNLSQPKFDDRKYLWMFESYPFCGKHSKGQRWTPENWHFVDHLQSLLQTTTHVSRQWYCSILSSMDKGQQGTGTCVPEAKLSNKLPLCDNSCQFDWWSVLFWGQSVTGSQTAGRTPMQNKTKLSNNKTSSWLILNESLHVSEHAGILHCTNY